MVFGGTWAAQNKILPGVYVNTVSRGAVSQALSDRGIAAFATKMNWGPEHEVFTVTPADFQNKSLEIFGYSATAPEMTGIRDLFKHAQKVYFYRLNGATGLKAAISYKPTDGVNVKIADAKYSGTRGNDVSVVSELNINSTEGNALYDITTYLNGIIVDQQQGVASIEDLKDNDFLIWEDSAQIMEFTAVGTGGTNADATNADLEAALKAFESYQFNIFSTDVLLDQASGDFVVSWVRRMRNDVGSKFQAVLYAPIDSDFSVDFEGIIAIQNDVIVDTGTGLTADGFNKAALTFWIAGAEAACPVNRALTATVYDGAFAVDLNYSKTDYESIIRKGRLALFRDGDSVKVLSDINGLVTYAEDKNYKFGKNQVIRVADQFAIEEAILFDTRYMGKVQNNANGRDSYKVGLIGICEAMETLEAIENFTADDVTVIEGNEIDTVVSTVGIHVVNTMEKLYVTNYIL